MSELDHQQKTLESIHQLDKSIVELKGDIRSMREHFDDQHQALSNKLDESVRMDTKRLDAHASDIDDHREQLAGLKEWKKQFEESVRNRFAIWQSISVVASVIIAYLLSKFF